MPLAAAVGPMAGVVSASMPVSVLEDAERGGRVYCTLNEGLGKVLRYGAYSPPVIARLQWLERVGPMLSTTLRRTGPVDVRRSSPRPCKWATSATTAIGL